MHQAFLIGVGNYPDHPQPVTNDLALLRRALLSRGYQPSDVHVFDSSHTTRRALLDLFESIRQVYATAAAGSCYVHVTASGVLAMEPLAGGIRPSDGTYEEFASAITFGVLNDYLPTRLDIHSVVTLDT
jgi:hypothetical protein